MGGLSRVLGPVVSDSLPGLGGSTFQHRIAPGFSESDTENSEPDILIPRKASRTRQGCASPTLSGAVFGWETPRDIRISRWLIQGESVVLSCSEARRARGPKKTTRGVSSSP